MESATAAGAGKHPPDDGGRGWRTPGVGEERFSNNGLDRTDKLLDEDRNADGEGSDDSAEMELWASLMDETNSHVVDSKKSLVDKPATAKRPRDADSDDDDCIILDGDPEKAVAVAKGEGPRHEEDTGDELQIVAEKGELACRDFPHPRHLCASLSFNTSSHASHCSMCHCYVCDSRAPCILWGNGTGINDHCHATDKDPKWKRLRQLFKCKSDKAPKQDGVQNLLQSSSTASANLLIPSTRRFPFSSTLSQIRQMHPSIMASQNMGQGIIQPRAPSPMARTTLIPFDRSKRARVAPPVYTPSSVNYMGPFAPCSSTMQPAFLRGFQTAQVPSRDTFWSLTGLPRPSAPALPLSAAKGFQGQGYQRQALPYPQMPPNTVVGTGMPLSRCTSLSTLGKQQQQGPSIDTSGTWSDILATLAQELGVPDDNTDPPVGQQSTSTPSQALYPNQLLAQAKARQGLHINLGNVAGQAPLPLRLSSRHNWSNRASGSTVFSSGAIHQARPPLWQLNSQSSHVPNGTTSSTVVRSQPRNVGGTRSSGGSQY